MAQPQPSPAPQAQQDPSQDPSQGQDQGGGDIMQVISQVGDGLKQLSTMISQAPGMDQEKQMIQQLSQGFDMFVESLQQDQGQQQQPADQGAVPMETGGKPSQPSL